MPKLKVTKPDMSFFEDSEVQEVFDELPPEMADEAPLAVEPESDTTTENTDINSEDTVSAAREEFYVSGTQPLNLGSGRYMPGEAVPAGLVDPFLLQSGHISVRKL